MAGAAWAQETNAPVATETPATQASPANHPTAATPPQQAIPFADFQNSALWRGYMALTRDLRPLFSLDADTMSMLTHIDTFELSQDTKKILLDLTGNENPLHVQATKLKNGSTNLAISLSELNFKDPKDGANGHIAELSGNVEFNKALNKSHTEMLLPLFHFESGATTQLTGGPIGFVSNWTRGPFDMPLGASSSTLGQLTIDDSAHGSAFRVHHRSASGNRNRLRSGAYGKCEINGQRILNV